MFRRTPEEETARNYCRSMCRKMGTRLTKTGDTVVIPACPRWPQGITTAFHGWIDLSERLRQCQLNPDNVVDGVLVIEYAEASAPCAPTAPAP